MKRLSVFSAIIGIVLIIGTGGFVFSQTTAGPNLTGYYVGINGNVYGPYDTMGLRQLISTGQLTRNSLVWKEGMINWAFASTVQELEPLFLPAMPPLSATQAPIQQQPAPPQQAAPPQQSAPPQQAVSPQQPAPPQQAASTNGPKEPWGNPAVAGLANSVFGIWSWTNGDYFGGFLTSFLEAGGAALMISSPYLYNATKNKILFWSAFYGGLAITAGGTVFGVVRGVTQYNKKMAAYRSFSEAISGNPLDNISLVAYPTADKRVAGALTYSLSF